MIFSTFKVHELKYFSQEPGAYGLGTLANMAKFCQLWKRCWLFGHVLGQGPGDKNIINSIWPLEVYGHVSGICVTLV